ncbi:MAG TPA: bifunctional adenosylcobinamide kinase/adenosylcobinamide-phosphate guanylyltransferase [Gemmatimonadaceae bacterium]|jgi:adenosylcobinamide kinase/adenosylcobinamide-phosphate guanylyltransferase
MAITLLLGGVRAGKSARAVSLAADASPNGRVLFVATAQAFDDEMRQRIDAHQRERPAGWVTLESPLDLPEELSQHLATSGSTYDVIIVDCLTLWVSNLILSLPESANAETHVADRVRDLLAVLQTHEAIGVSNEVGLGIVPPTSLGRRYRDALGRANQLVASAATDVRLLIAGIELPLKSRG